MYEKGKRERGLKDFTVGTVRGISDLLQQSYSICVSDNVT